MCGCNLVTPRSSVPAPEQKQVWQLGDIGSNALGRQTARPAFSSGRDLGGSGHHAGADLRIRDRCERLVRLLPAKALFYALISEGRV
jgi:hypothetical protein